MGLDPAVHSTMPELRGQRLRASFGSGRQPTRIADLDLIAQRRPLAVGERRDPRRVCAASWAATVSICTPWKNPA